MDGFSLDRRQRPRIGRRRTRVAVIDAAVVLAVVGLAAGCADQPRVLELTPGPSVRPGTTESPRPSATATPGTSAAALAGDPTESASAEAPSSPSAEDPTFVPFDPHTYPVLGGRAKVTLSSYWQPSSSIPDLFQWKSHELSFAVGDRHGRITTCEPVQGPWEACRELVAEDIDDLVGAVWPATSKSGNDYGQLADRIDGMMDGEPSVALRFDGYQYPAHGGQEVGYVVTIHDGRPFILRMWTSENHLRQFEAVIDGFRFTD